MTQTLLAVLVAVVGLAVTLLWFGVARRRREETAIGVKTLADMKWRDCVAVVLEALQGEGYKRPARSASVGDVSEFLLERGGEKVLFGYKHGTAYQLNAANVREFSAALGMRGASSGLLLTLGTIEGPARTAAEMANIQLVDGAALWSKVRPLLPAALVDAVSDEAARGAGKRIWTGVGLSVLAALAAYFLPVPSPPATATIARVPVSTPVSSTAPAGSASSARTPAPASDTRMLAQLNATAERMAEVARLTTEQLARRRAEAAKQVSLLPQVDSAAWSAQRTLLLSLNRTDGKDKSLVEEACRILVQHEEMRFTRIQLNPPADSGLAVRWRLCE